VRNYAADKAARDEALRVVELWKSDLAAGRGTWLSPTIPFSKQPPSPK
jgi:hypothetical protein